MKIKDALNSAVKVLYVMPAVLWCTVSFLLLMIGSWQDAFPVFRLYPTLPAVAAVLLWKGKWWGCLPGIGMGIMLFSLVPNEEVSGLRYCVYFALMGLLCSLTHRQKGEKQ